MDKVKEKNLRFHDVSSTGPAWYTTDPRVSPALARWHAHARTNGGLAGTYGRIGPHGRSRCSCAAAVPETAAHVYMRCPKYSALCPVLLAAVAAWCDDVEAGGSPRPGVAGALRWVHENTDHIGGPTLGHLLHGRACCGSDLRLAAYTFWKAATKLRRASRGLASHGPRSPTAPPARPPPPPCTPCTPSL
jgi:hypothetical protein